MNTINKKKMKKLLKIGTCLFVLLLAFTVASCKGTEDQDDKDTDVVQGNYTTFEAEGIDLTGFSAPGPSNTYVGTQMIWGNTGSTRDYFTQSVLDSISGYVIAPMTMSTNVLTFDITSNEIAKDCQLRIKMAIENGYKFPSSKMPLNSEIMKIEVNDKELNYSTINIQGSANRKYDVTFKNYNVSTKFDLNKGKNTIKLIVVPNTTAQMTEAAEGGAPAIDNISVKSTSKLTWESQEETNKLIAGLE